MIKTCYKCLRDKPLAYGRMIKTKSNGERFMCNACKDKIVKAKK